MRQRTSVRYNLTCLLFLIAFYSLSLRVRREEPQLNDSHSVTIWLPYNNKKCEGDFIHRSTNGHISFLIRDVAVDDRHVSLREASKQFAGKSFRRLQVFFSVIPNPQLGMYAEISSISAELPPLAELLFPDLSQVLEVKILFDYFLEDQPFQRNCITHKTCRVREWQAILTLVDQENESDALFNQKLGYLLREGVSLHFKLPVVLRESNQTSISKFKVSLGCFEGISNYGYLGNMFNFTHDTGNCHRVKNAIAISGAPLFGGNRNDINQWRNIAHYAARHLYGHTWYDAVAVALLPKYTLSHIQNECRNDHMCESFLVEQNIEYMKSIRNEVEKELTALQIPSKEWNRIILFQFCALGSDFTGSERNEPCAASFHGGQKILGLVGYTRFGSHFAWASNFDLDELLVDELALAQKSNTEIRRMQSAADRFHSLRRATNKSSFYALWMDFSVPKLDHRDFTKKIMNGERIGFKNKSSTSNYVSLSECYGGGGKVFTHCSSTVGLLAHYALKVEKNGKLNEYKCAPPRTKRRTRLFRTIPFETEIYTWHVRDPPRQGNCLFDKSYKQLEKTCSIRPRSSLECSASVPN